MAYENISPRQGTSARFSILAVLIITSLLWVVFFAMEGKIRAKAGVDKAKNEQRIVDLLTLTGTVLAIITLTGIYFFIYVENFQ